MKSTTKDVNAIISLVLRAVAVAMAVVTIVMGTLDAGDTNTYLTLLAIGLFTLALDALDNHKEASK